MENFIIVAQQILMQRRPRHYTRLQVLNWMVKRLQFNPHTSSK